MVYLDVDGTILVTYFTYRVSLCQKLFFISKGHVRRQSWSTLWRLTFIRLLGVKDTTRDQSGWLV
jgi:hypothetical protein